MSNNFAIKTIDLTKKFGNFTACDNLTFEVHKGEIFGFLGANGAGKTTAMKMLSGLLSPTSGTAKIADYDIYKESEKIKKNIGYMSQKFSLYDDLTIQENINFFAGIYGLSNKLIKEKSEVVINELDLKKQQNKLVGSLPLGWKQKLAFSIAIFHNPAIVFLDEPTGGVDPVTRRQFWDLIYQSAERGLTVFLTTHYMDESEYCNRIAIMANGKLAAIGTPKELKESNSSSSMNDVFIQIARGKNYV